MFKAKFKYYKSKDPLPSYEDVINLHSEESIKSNILRVKKIKIKDYQVHSPFLVDCDDWAVYELLSNPGFLYVRNPFTTLGQRYWIVRALRDFTQKPNTLNIDPFNFVPANTDWWTLSQTDLNVRKKLRWATLGYHHNWNTKLYSEDSKGPFPEDLNKLCSVFANALGFVNYRSEAAIINFYHLDSTLSGHTDHSEQNVEAPIYSFSFGNSAIFLLGGETLEEAPTAVFLHSGDVVAMGQPSRLCYHAVPKIIECEKSKQSWNLQIDSLIKDSCNDYLDDKIFEPFKNYLVDSRININVRQVLKHGCKQLLKS